MENNQSNPELPDAIATEQLRKLRLEIAALEKQNSWRGYVTQYGTILTVLATAVGIWLSIEKFRLDNEKDRLLREKELTERIDNQYRPALRELLQFPVDEKQTIPLVISSLLDVNQLIEMRAPQKDEQERQKSSVALLIANIVNATDYDLRKPRNVEYDLTALKYWDYYPAYLRSKPEINKDIISKYFECLRYLHNQDKKFFEALKIDSRGDFYSYKPADDEKMFIHFIDLFYGYKSHYEILKKSLDDMPQDAQKISGDLELAFCWFYSATKNEALVEQIFGDDSSKLKAKWKECP